MKCAIFVNWSHTTNIALYPWASGSLVIKSAVMCVQGFLGASFGISFPAGVTALFLFCWHKSHPSMYLFISFITPSHQKFCVTSSTVFHCPPCPPTSVLWCNWIISALSSSSFSMYTFSSFSISPSSFFHSLSLSILTLAHFISSTALITSSSFAFGFLTFSSRSTPLISTSSTLSFLNHSTFTSVLSLLSFSTSFLQSGLLLSLSAFPILVPGTCFNVKSNLNRNNTYLACCLFSFWFIMKYSKFL